MCNHTKCCVVAHCVRVVSEMHDDTSHRLYIYGIVAVHTGVQYLYCISDLGASAVSANTNVSCIQYQ